MQLDVSKIRARFLSLSRDHRDSPARKTSGETSGRSVSVFNNGITGNRRTQMTDS